MLVTHYTTLYWPLTTSYELTVASFTLQAGPVTESLVVAVLLGTTTVEVGAGNVLIQVADVRIHRPVVESN